MNNHRSSTGAIILIAFGILFLLNNLGVFPWSVWFVVWKFWPVVLILLGLKLILGKDKNHEAFTTISFLIILVVLLIAIATVNPTIRSWMQSHMSWMPLNQMMPNNNTSPFNNNMHNRRFRMFFQNGDNNTFDNQDFNLNY